MAIRKPRQNTEFQRGRFRFQSYGLGLAASSRSCGPLALRQHGTGLLAGAGVDEVVAEEDLRGRGTGSAVLGHVVRGDADGGVVRLFDHLDGHSLGVSAADAVALAFGGLDDQIDSTVVGEVLIQLEGEVLTLTHDGGRGRSLHTHERGRGGEGLTALISAEAQHGRWSRVQSA